MYIWILQCRKHPVNPPEKRSLTGNQLSKHSIASLQILASKNPSPAPSEYDFPPPSPPLHKVNLPSPARRSTCPDIRHPSAASPAPPTCRRSSPAAPPGRPARSRPGGSMREAVTGGASRCWFQDLEKEKVKKALELKAQALERKAISLQLKAQAQRNKVWAEQMFLGGSGSRPFRGITRDCRARMRSLQANKRLHTG